MKITGYLIYTLLILFVCSCSSGKQSKQDQEMETQAGSKPRQAVLPHVPNRISEREAFNNYLDTLSSPLGLSVIMNNPGNKSTFTFCNDSLVVLQVSNTEWMLGLWQMEDKLIRIHFFKALGDRGIGDPITKPAATDQAALYNEYVPYVYETDDEQIYHWEEMKAIMQTGGNSLFILENRKDSCTLSKYFFQLPGKYSYVSTRLMETRELEKTGETEISLMINEVYARYGLIFRDRKLKEYFAKQAWYKPRHPNVDKYLQGIEEKNLQILREKEISILKAKPAKPSKTPAKKKSSIKKSTKNK